VTRAQDLQRKYYTETADSYDGHLAEVEHTIALRYVSAYVHMLGLNSILDVGCGTGRALMYLARSHTHLRLVGLEPVKALLTQATLSNGVAAERLVRGVGDALPFADSSFDAVCEVGVLHHVPDPAAVVREMTRVARRAVFLSDTNRFGRTSVPAGVVKLVLWRAGLGGLVHRVRTHGRGYSISQGDGVAYSYSVYDSLPQLSQWAEHVALIPTLEERTHTSFRPLLNASHVLAVAVKDRQDLLDDDSRK
jgi:SAM-dependent methyltransferase